MLGDDVKRKQFEEYLMYNLDLFMIKYEKQLAPTVGQEPAFTEPVIPKPEGAVIRQDTDEPFAGEEEDVPAPDTVAGSPADEELPEI